MALDIRKNNSETNQIEIAKLYNKYKFTIINKDFYILWFLKIRISLDI